MNLASAVTRAVLKQVDLPESVIRWMYDFVRVESKNGYQAFKPYRDTLLEEYWQDFEKLDKEEEKELRSYNKKSAESRAKSNYDPEDVYHVKRKNLERGLENRKARIPSNPEALLIPYTIFLLSVFESIPPIKDRYTGNITTTIRDLLPEERIFNYDISPYHSELISWMRLPDYFLEHEVDIDIPKRFEHVHITGSTGSGKTVLLKQLIFKDTKDEDASIVAMAPKGDLIPFLLGSPIPKERIVFIHPYEGLSLNLFDIGSGKSNITVSLINYVIGSLLDADTTAKQTGLLNYCIRLCLEIPNATIRTLRDILKERHVPVKYEGYIANLSQAGQDFFKDSFSDTEYRKTKSEVMWRIDALLNNEFIEKIFCQPRTTVKFSNELENKKVILIDTSIEKLGEEGSKFFGRFFIALLNLASQRRKNDHPVYTYIDEASQYLDRNIESMLELAREAKVSITLSHQQLGQLGDLSPTVMSNTHTKFVGGCSVDDARVLSKELQIEPGELINLPTFSFVVKCKGVKAIKAVYPPKYINSLPQRDTSQFYQHTPVEEPVVLKKVAEDENIYDVPGSDIDDWHDP